MEAIRFILGHCQHVEGGRVWTVHFEDTGYDAITFSRTYTMGLGASAFRVIRVGKGILLTHVYGEGTLEAIGPTLRRQTRLGRDLAAEMCVFARAGC
ncbi:hypothetical protein [Nocardioides sp. B-3]|uniref:hypothetical protein n=1 Tax=Nocardioides sp. B-3 TaxID=2895565 RepID=UPI0021536D10|nr:hypothetical protein [Nocardioides sp. B-3]UUZ57987.1 hypothetical protein LP418_16835 [Nocardioides sp. B-3]